MSSGAWKQAEAVGAVVNWNEAYLDHEEAGKLRAKLFVLDDELKGSKEQREAHRTRSKSHQQTHKPALRAE